MLIQPQVQSQSRSRRGRVGIVTMADKVKLRSMTEVADAKVLKVRAKRLYKTLQVKVL